MSFIYWVYFDKVGQPERIVAKTAIEFFEILQQMIHRTSEMPEWIQRTYK